jgi:hypothetical protein
MKKHEVYYLMGAVLIGTGLYLYYSKNSKNNVDDELQLGGSSISVPPLEVSELNVPNAPTIIKNSLTILK